MRRRSLLILVVACVSLLLTAIPVLASSDLKNYLPTIAASHESYHDSQIDGAMLSDGSIQVSVTAPDGTSIFESRYPVEKPDGRYLEWQYRIEPVLSRSTRLDQSTFMTLEAMTLAAKDIVRMIRRGGTPEGTSRVRSAGFVVRPEDDYGCDWPANDLSCTSVGNCCDEHDRCYAENDCEALSWTGYATPACILCNTNAVFCITTGLGSNGQPSECCAAGNCGQPRPVASSPFGSGPLGPLTGPPDWDAASPGGGGGGWTTTTTGGTTISVGGGWCRFPNGQIVPCG